MGLHLSHKAETRETRQEWTVKRAETPNQPCIGWLTRNDGSLQRPFRSWPAAANCTPTRLVVARFRRCGCVRRRDRERGGSNLTQQVCATMMNAGTPQRNPQPRESSDDFVPGFSGSGRNHLIGPSCHAMLAVLARNHGEVSDEVR